VWRAPQQLLKRRLNLLHMPIPFSRSSSGSLVDPLSRSSSGSLVDPFSRSSSGSLVALCCSDGTVIAPKIRWARTPLQRIKGLLRGPELAEGEAFILCPAAQVHSIGLGYEIDVIFCDKRWVVQRVVAPLRRNRVSPMVVGARYAIELRAGAAAGVLPDSVLSLRPEVRRSRS